MFKYIYNKIILIAPKNKSEKLNNVTRWSLYPSYFTFQVLYPEHILMEKQVKNKKKFLNNSFT